MEDSAEEILRSLPSEIQDAVKLWAEHSPSHPALVENSGTWTYRELSSAISAAAGLLREGGVRPGDRVMIVGENSRVFVAILMGSLQLGAWAVPVNARLSAREIDEIQEHCRPRRVVYVVGNSAQARQHAKRKGAEASDFPSAGSIAVGPLNELAEPEPAGSDPANHVAVVIYTSGTTGGQKGVMLTHRNVLYAASVASKIRGLVPQDRMYGILPMSHSAGLSVVLVATLLSGATLYIAGYFDPVATLAALEKDKITVMLGVPSMFALLVEYVRSKNNQKITLPALRILSSSGAPLNQKLKNDVESIFGTALHNAYGASEMSPNISQTRIEDPLRDISAGPLVSGVRARLVGKDGISVPPGEVGELHVCGPNMMKGYYRSPEETAAAFDSEGWFNTRDLARFEGKNLYVVGRSKEMIIRFGFNVYPAEVEAVLNSHSAVSRSAVIGRTGEGVVGQEEVIAFVQLVPGTRATSNEITEHAAAHLAPYKVPSQVVILEALPQTASGKIAKAELAKMIPQQMPAS